MGQVHRMNTMAGQSLRGIGPAPMRVGNVESSGRNNRASPGVQEGWGNHHGAAMDLCQEMERRDLRKVWSPENKPGTAPNHATGQLRARPVLVLNGYVHITGIRFAPESRLRIGGVLAPQRRFGFSVALPPKRCLAPERGVGIRIALAPEGC